MEQNHSSQRTFLVAAKKPKSRSICTSAAFFPRRDLGCLCVELSPRDLPAVGFGEILDAPDAVAVRQLARTGLC